MIIKQIRYYDEGYEGDLNNKSKKELNQPSDITAEKLISGEYFNGIRCKEIQIKTYPGTKLTINGEIVTIGDVGVYNILYRENVTITSLLIDPDSIQYIKNDPREFFVITFIIPEEDAEEEIIDNSENNDNSGENPTEPGEDSEISDDENTPSGSSISVQIKVDNHDDPKKH